MQEELPPLQTWFYDLKQAPAYELIDLWCKYWRASTDSFAYRRIANCYKDPEGVLRLSDLRNDEDRSRINFREEVTPTIPDDMRPVAWALVPSINGR